MRTRVQQRAWDILKSEQIISENSRETWWFSEKNSKSLGDRSAKISKFLGNLPSEHIFYRNIPLGAPVLGCDEWDCFSKAKQA